MPEKDCGSPICLVDRLEETVTKQHTESMTFMRELFKTHVEIIQKEIADVKEDIKTQGDELYGRMRQVENRVTAVETRWVESEELKAVRSLRTWLGRVLAGVVIAAILAAGAYFLFIYDTHGRPTVYQQEQKK
jgi:CHASE3 domain sensor protein